MTSDTPAAADDLLIIDDDEPFRVRLGRAMEKRGYAVRLAGSFKEGLDMAMVEPPRYAIVDLRLGDGNGLDLVTEMRKVAPTARMVILTGYGNIATAVVAMKTGAIDYLPKPSEADAIDAALRGGAKALPEPPDHPMPADRVRWEHIQRVFEQCDRNVSETARRLNMHRRTLQRILAKHAPREQT